jgi:RHS repeat-associated protein
MRVDSSAAAAWSTADVTDSTGALKASYAYDPWGRLLNPIDPLGTKDKFKFAGEALDPQTGLYYLRARYYDPSIGRFISKDPLAGSIFVPISSNRFAYALSNPLRYKDTLGLAAEQNGGDQNLGSWWYTESPTPSTLVDTALYGFGLASAPFGLAGGIFGLSTGIYSSAVDIATNNFANLLGFDYTGLLLGGAALAGAEVAAPAALLGGVGLFLSHSDTILGPFDNYLSSEFGSWQISLNPDLSDF